MGKLEAREAGKFKSDVPLLGLFLNDNRLYAKPDERNRFQQLLDDEKMRIMGDIFTHTNSVQWVYATTDVMASMILEQMSHFATTDGHAVQDVEEIVAIDEDIPPVHPLSQTSKEDMQEAVETIYLIGWQGGRSMQYFVPHILEQLRRDRTVNFSYSPSRRERRAQKRALQTAIRTIIGVAADDSASQGSSISSLRTETLRKQIANIDALDSLGE